MVKCFNSFIFLFRSFVYWTDKYSSSSLALIPKNFDSIFFSFFLSCKAKGSITLSKLHLWINRKLVGLVNRLIVLRMVYCIMKRHGLAILWIATEFFLINQLFFFYFGLDNVKQSQRAQLSNWKLNSWTMCPIGNGQQTNKNTHTLMYQHKNKVIKFSLSITNEFSTFRYLHQVHWKKITPQLSEMKLKLFIFVLCVLS